MRGVLWDAAPLRVPSVVRWKVLHKPQLLPLRMLFLPRGDPASKRVLPSIYNNSDRLSFRGPYLNSLPYSEILV